MGGVEKHRLFRKATAWLKMETDSKGEKKVSNVMVGIGTEDKGASGGGRGVGVGDFHWGGAGGGAHVRTGRTGVCGHGTCRAACRSFKKKWGVFVVFKSPAQSVEFEPKAQLRDSSKFPRAQCQALTTQFNGPAVIPKSTLLGPSL